MMAQSKVGMLKRVVVGLSVITFTRRLVLLRISQKSFGGIGAAIKKQVFTKFS